MQWTGVTTVRRSSSPANHVSRKNGLWATQPIFVCHDLFGHMVTISRLPSLSAQADHTKEECALQPAQNQRHGFEQQEPVGGSDREEKTTRSL